MSAHRESMSSKERIRATVAGRPVDHTPLCFEGIGHPYVAFVNRLYPDPFDRARFYRDLGVDTAVALHDLPITAGGYETRHGAEPLPDGGAATITEYVTPVGSLRQVVRKTPDYPHRHPPLFSDHHVPPGRSIQYLVSSPTDLDALERILQPPAEVDLDAFRRHARRARRFCDENGLLLAGTLWGVGDPMIWFTGVEPLVLWAVEQPESFGRYVDIVARWQQRRLEMQLDVGVDLIYRRGWYESTDFWSPGLYRQFFFDPIDREITAAHQADALYTYIMNTGAMDLLEMFGELGFDIYSNIDPLAGSTDLGRIKRTVGGALTLYGGVNNNLILERGSAEQTRRAVEEAFEALGGGRFILGPGDSVLTDDEATRRNIHAMIDAWKTLR